MHNTQQILQDLFRVRALQIQPELSAAHCNTIDNIAPLRSYIIYGNTGRSRYRIIVEFEFEFEDRDDGDHALTAVYTH